MSTELRNTSDDGACFLCGPPPEEEQEKQNFSRRQVLTHGLFTGRSKSTRLNSSHIQKSRMPSSA